MLLDRSLVGVNETRIGAVRLYSGNHLVDVPNCVLAVRFDRTARGRNHVFKRS